MIKSFRWLLEMKILGIVLTFALVLAHFSNAILWIYTKKFKNSDVQTRFTLHI